MTKEQKEAVEKIEKLLKEITKAIETLDKRVSAIEDIVYSGIEFTPDFFVDRTN